MFLNISKVCFLSTGGTHRCTHLFVARPRAPHTRWTRDGGQACPKLRRAVRGSRFFILGLCLLPPKVGDRDGVKSFPKLGYTCAESLVATGVVLTGVVLRSVTQKTAGSQQGMASITVDRKEYDTCCDGGETYDAALQRGVVLHACLAVGGLGLRPCARGFGWHWMGCLRLVDAQASRKGLCASRRSPPWSTLVILHSVEYVQGAPGDSGINREMKALRDPSLPKHSVPNKTTACFAVKPTRTSRKGVP